MIGVTASIDLRLALVALLVGPVLAVLSQVYRRRLRREWSLAKEQQSSAMSVLQESLSAVRVVKAFGQEERERDRYLERARAGLLAQLKVVFAEGWLGLLIGLTMAAGTAAVLYLGVRSVRSGDLTLGSLLLVMSYLAQLYPPLQEVGGKLTDIQKSLASAERAFALLDEPAEVASAPGALPVGRARGAVALENVTFGYVPGRPALREVSLEVPAGARVGIAGRTGAGKSTLLALLPRFYDPWAGRVLLDGRDLRDLDLADLRRQFSIVLQEPVLFSATVAENIAYGRPAATEAEIEAAARAAGAHDFVAALPEGYRTEVGERGARLSGGERQRIALARAFLKDAPILLLDEPTSSVDVKTEAGIINAIERLMRGRTTFLIAHRLATLEGCDLRLEVADERVHLRSGDLSGVALPGPGSGPEPGDPA
jgi:ATP-binding cassette subfamily B protein